MRKFLAAVVAVLLCCTAVFAQKTKSKAILGFKAGVNISTFRMAVDYPDFDPSMKLGQVFGAFVQIPVCASRFTIQPEFLYSQLGSKANSTLWGDATFKYNYFSIPVLVKYNVSKGFDVLAGLESDVLIRGQLKQLDKTKTVTYDMNDFDFAYTAGFSAYSKQWVFDMRYIHGSHDVSPASELNTLYNQAVQMTLGYKLLPKAKKGKTAK